MVASGADTERFTRELGDMSSIRTVTLEAVTQQIIDLVGKDVGAVDLTADSSLQSQGLDSLKVMSLVFKIEEHYDIVLDEEDADDLRTVGDLAALVVRRIEQQP
jgi:acyl carrier protein